MVSRWSGTVSPAAAISSGVTAASAPGAAGLTPAPAGPGRAAAAGFEACTSRRPAAFLIVTFNRGDSTVSSVMSASLAIFSNARISSRSNFCSIGIEPAFPGPREAVASAAGQALHLPPHPAVLLVPQVEQPVDGHIFDRLEVPSQGLAHRRRGGVGILVRAALRFGDDLVDDAQSRQNPGRQAQRLGRLLGA